MKNNQKIEIGSLVRYTSALDPQPHDLERHGEYGVVCKYPSPNGSWIVEVRWYDGEKTWVFIGNLEVIA